MKIFFYQFEIFSIMNSSMLSYFNLTGRNLQINRASSFYSVDLHVKDFEFHSVDHMLLRKVNTSLLPNILELPL